MYTERSSPSGVEKLGRLAGEAEEVYAMFNNSRDASPRAAP